VTPSLEPAFTWLLPLTRQGKLAPSSVEQVMRDLESTLAVPPPPLDEPPAPTAPLTGLIEPPPVPAAAGTSPAEEPPRRGLAIGAILGERQRGVSRQLASALCGVYRCVPRLRVTTAGTVDFSKMDEHGVEGFLFGSVTRDGDLWLALATASPEPSHTWQLPLTRRGKLDPGSVEQVKRDIESALGAPSAPPAAPPMVAAAPPPPPQAELPAPTAPMAGPVESPRAPATLVEASRARAPAAAEARAVPRHERRQARWVFAAEAGTFVTNRSLSYSGAAPGPTPLLRGYQGLVAGPCLSLEVLPVSPFTDHVLLAGIGVFAEYAFSQGLETTVGSRSYPSTFSALDAGLEWRVRPFSSSDLALVPATSYRMQRFAVTPPFPGLPDSSLSGVAGSLRIEVPLGEAVTLLLGGSYTRWLSAKDLVGGGFFPAGSAYALEVDAGVGVAIYGPLSLRAMGFYDTTRYALEVGPRPLYRATAAGDSQVGGRATARARF